MNNFKLFSYCILFIFLASCGYKLGGLETVGENQGKVAVIKILSNQNFKQSFINAGFKINNNEFMYIISIEGPNYTKETTSVTSNATENEFTITGTILITLEDKDGSTLFRNKIFSLSKDHKFSSSSINSSESEENTIKNDIKKYLEIQAINFVRSKI